MSTDRPAYGRRAESRDLVPYQGETYYSLPAVKASHYGWKISGYFFVGGLAGSAQVLAAIADLTGRRRIARAGRYLALAGSIASPVLLIADLHTPERWYNMLRIFRTTSPMSIGAWTLGAFGTFSGLAALGQLWEDVTGSLRGRWLARVLGIPGALAGGMMSIYTGTLLAATSTPLWASTPRLLPALFGASAASTAAAALTVALEAGGASEEEHHAVERFALVAGAVELGVTAVTRSAWRQQQLDEPLRQEPLASTLRLGAVGLGVVVPLVIHAAQAITGRRSRAASLLAAGSALVGGFLMRSVVLFAGNRSAQRPQDYFHFTQPTTADQLTGPEPVRDRLMTEVP